MKSNFQNVIWAGDMNLMINDLAFEKILLHGFKSTLQGEKTSLKQACKNGVYLNRAEDNILYKLNDFSLYNSKVDRFCWNQYLYRCNLEKTQFIGSSSNPGNHKRIRFMRENKISLISNSGLQFHRFNIEIDPNADVTKSVRFYEWFDTDSYKIKLEYAHYLPAEDIYVSKRSLLEEGYLIDGQVSGRNKFN